MTRTNTIYSGISEAQIEHRAQCLLAEIKARHRQLMPGGVDNPVDLLDPPIIAKVLGVECEYCPDLGNFGDRDGRFVVAGALDRKRGVISISERFSPEEQRFTAGHEFGHLLLHPFEQIHRDRPIKGLTWNDVGGRPRMESEADYFGGCLLMPERFVKKEFTEKFGEVPLHVDLHLAWHLNPQNPDQLLRPYCNSLDRELALASATNLGFGKMCSLAETFRVSVQSMAIRIRQLGLIAD